jgi:hypothetical protein
MYKTGRQKNQGPLNGHHEITFSDENNMDYFSKPKTLYLHETSSTKSELEGLQCATLDSFQHKQHSNYPRNSRKILMNGCIPLQLPGA